MTNYGNFEATDESKLVTELVILNLSYLQLIDVNPVHNDNLINQ